MPDTGCRISDLVQPVKSAQSRQVGTGRANGLTGSIPPLGQTVLNGLNRLTGKLANRPTDRRS